MTLSVPEFDDFDIGDDGDNYPEYEYDDFDDYDDEGEDFIEMGIDEDYELNDDDHEPDFTPIADDWLDDPAGFYEDDDF